MGQVYAGFDAERGIEVAIKRMRDPGAAAATRMRREAQVLRSLDHPYLCPLLDWGQEGDDVWIVMPRLPGESLDQCLGKIDIELRIILLIQACVGVEAAHKAGLIHRDLKPANLMVDLDSADAPRLRVLDFGIATSDEKDRTALTATGQIIGTPAYMSPEQARGDALHVDRRADIWALGAILYEMLVGQPPFGGDSSSHVLARLLSEDVRPPRQINPRVSEALARICMRCLEEDPGRRYQSAGALARDLRRYLDGESVSAPAIGPWFRLRRSWARSRPLWLLASVSSLIVLIVLGFLVHAYRSGIVERRQAAELAGTAERIRAHMRVAHLVPIHDIDIDRAPLIDRIGQLQASPPPTSEDLLLIRERALGDGELALGRIDVAATHFARVVASDKATGGDHDRFADVQLRRYLDARRRALDLPAEQAEVVIEGLRKQWLEPARTAAIAARNEGALGTQTAARLALSDDDANQAIALLDGDRAATSDDYGAILLHGEIAYWQAQRARDLGDTLGAVSAIEQSLDAFRQAARIGRSDPLTLQQVCLASVAKVKFSTESGAAAPTDLAALADECVAMRIASPSDERGAEIESRAWEAISQAHAARNEMDPAFAALDTALKSVSDAITRTPQSRDLHLLRARLLRQSARYHYDDFERTQSLFAQSLADLEQVERLSPGFWPARVETGRLLSNRGRHRANFGRDPATDYARATEILTSALEEKPDSVEVRKALSLVHVFYFYAFRDPDPVAAETHALEAIALLDVAIASNPENVDLLFEQAANRGDYWLFLAARDESEEFERLLGDLDKGLALLAKVRELAPQRADGYGQALAMLNAASELMRARGLPRDRYIDATTALLADAEVAGISIDHSFAAGAALERAEALGQRADPATRDAFERAEHWLEQGESSPDQKFTISRYRLQWASAKAAWLRATRQSTSAVLAVGEATFAGFETSVRGEIDNIAICEAGRLFHEKSLSGAVAQRRAAQLRSRELFDKCRATSESYFAAYWSRYVEQIAKQDSMPADG